MWLDAGGVYALPNLRGGGEYGEDWHRAGMLGNKQNVFDDFLNAAEWLIEHGYTKPERLAITGGSNGGLLVGAALTQRPELFRAVVCSVPLLDMLRYHDKSDRAAVDPGATARPRIPSSSTGCAPTRPTTTSATASATRRSCSPPPKATVASIRCTRAR